MPVLVAGGQIVERGLGRLGAPDVPHGLELPADPLADLRRRAPVDGVLGEMKLAALPFRARESRPAGDLQADVVVGDNELDAAQATGDEAVEEVAPVRFSLRGLDREPQDATADAKHH